jgi:hypothetical protein
MAAIVPLAGKIATLTVNSVAVRLTRGRIRIGNQVLEFATTGQTADADTQYWMNRLSGLNSWEFEGDGYIDHHATAATRLIGDTIKFRPGTSAAGVLAVLFTTGHGFTGSGVVEFIEAAYDAEGSKPDTFRVTMKGDGALTYTNT